MKRYTILIAFVLVLVAVLVIPAGSAFAQTVVHTGFLDIIVEEGETREGDVSVSGGELIVKAGGKIEGDVLVFGGNATIDGNIDGDMVVFGGNVTLSGDVDGDLATFGGNLEITDSGMIDGDCVVLGGNVSDSSNHTSCATVGGSYVNEFLPRDDMGSLIEPPQVPDPGDFAIPPIEPPSTWAGIGGFLVGVGGAIGRSLIAAFVAFLIAALMPEQLTRTGNVVRDKPVASGLVGVLTMVTFPAVLTLLLILSAILIIACGLGLLGFPIAIVLVIALVAAGAFGWVAMGNLLGRKMTRWLRMNKASLAFTATFGTFILSLVLGLLGVPGGFPPEGIFTFVILALGLGATVLTQFGTKLYPREPEMDNTDKVEVVLRNMPTTE